MSKPLRLRVAQIVAAAALITVSGVGARADGAIALGITGNISQDGYSIGVAYNQPNFDDARAGALDHCRSHGGMPSRAKCELLVTFQKQCVAEAEDPQINTPGAGWALGPDKPTAEKLAMSLCLATAGTDRQRYCKLTTSVCDGIDSPSGPAGK